MGKIMIYGCTSSAGKSLITTGLCRVLSNMGKSVSPFKSQNMSRKYGITKEGKILSTAQILQARGARIDEEVRMNPLLLVPSTDTGSEVYLLGESQGHMEAAEYFEYKKDMGPEIKKIFDELKNDYDYVVIEGAGSPAEINLIENDIVNTGMARLADSNALLVVDIDRGGAFAALYGTYFILPKEDRDRIKGFIINKFRGDPTLLTSGIETIESLTGVPVLGIMPYKNYDLPDEDTLVEGREVLDFKDVEDSALDTSIEELARDVEQNLNIEKILEIMER